MPASTSLQSIENFLAQKRFAMIGLSRDPKHFSAMLFQEFLRRGYDVVPVNPNSSEILGRPCFTHVQDIQPAVEAALLMTSPDVTEAVVPDCVAAGIRQIWMYGINGKGAVNSQSVAFCKQHGIDVIPGECPFMFFSKNGFHRLHTLWNKLTGAYPRRRPCIGQPA